MTVRVRKGPVVLQAWSAGDVSRTWRSRCSDSRTAAPVFFARTAVTVAKTVDFVPYIELFVDMVLLAVAQARSGCAPVT